MLNNIHTLQVNIELTPNLKDKKHYVIYYRNLELYLQLGLQLTKIHKIIKFKRAP